MKRNYKLTHRLVAYALLLSLYLQSCGNFSNSLTPREDEQTANTPISTKQQERFIHLKSFDDGNQLPFMYIADMSLQGGMKRSNIKVEKEEGEEQGEPKSNPITKRRRVEKLTSIDELRPHFDKRYLEITPQNYEQLVELSKKHRSSFMNYDGGVFVMQCWKGTNRFKELLNLLQQFTKIKRFKINCEHQDENELAKLIRQSVQFYEDLIELNLRGCKLSDSTAKDIIKSIEHSEILKILNVKDNDLSTCMLGMLQTKFPNAQVKFSSNLEDKSEEKELGKGANTETAEQEYETVVLEQPDKANLGKRAPDIIKTSQQPFTKRQRVDLPSLVPIEISSLEMVQQEATTEDREAQKQYELGKNLEKDSFTEAIECYKKAAEAGHKEAQNRLIGLREAGRYSNFNEGVMKCYQEAVNAATGHEFTSFEEFIRKTNATPAAMKLADLIVMQLDPKKAPIHIEWGGDPQDYEKANYIFGPLFKLPSMKQYEASVMAIDPSGDGEDETAIV